MIGVALDLGHERNGSTGAAAFTANGKEMLRLHAMISSTSRTASLDASAPGLELSWRLEFEDDALTAPGRIAGTVDGLEIRGVLDPDTGRTTANVSLGYWLPPEVANELSPLSPIIESANAHYNLLAREAGALRGGAPRPGAVTGGGTAMKINWGKVACWGFAGLGAAASCAGSFGLACGAGGFVFGAAASICCQAQDE